MAALRLDVLKEIPLLAVSQAAIDLARRFIAVGVLPSLADRDAAHIGIATVQRMDILLTWNCRHIANAAIQDRLRRTAADLGLKLPTICTPEELLGHSYE